MQAKARLRQRAAAGLDEPPQPIVVKDRNRVFIIPVETLDYVEAQADYVALHSGGKTHLKLQSITSMGAALESAGFVRVHRSRIVNVERIVRIAPYARDSAVTLADGTRLGVSRAGYARLLAAIESSPAGSFPARLDATSSATGA